MTVINAGTLAAGDYVAFEGLNVGEQGISSQNGLLCELAKVTTRNGNVLTLAWPLYQTHTVSGVTVKAVTPVVGFELENVTLEGYASGNTACGLYVKYAVDVKTRGVRGKDFSRATLGMESIKGWDDREFVGRWRCNQ